MSQGTSTQESSEKLQGCNCSVNESLRTYARGMPHIWMRHVTHLNESCHVWMSHFTYARVMSHIWMSHSTRMNESCHTYEWVMSHIYMSHVTRMNVSLHTYDWVMARAWMSHLTHTKEFLQKSARLWMSHGTHRHKHTHRHRRRHTHPHPPTHEGVIAETSMRMNESWLTQAQTHTHTYKYTSTHTHPHPRRSPWRNQSHEGVVAEINRMHGSWHAHEWVMAHICDSSVTHTRELLQTWQNPIARWRSRGTRMNESWHTHTQTRTHTHKYTPTHAPDRHRSQANDPWNHILTHRHRHRHTYKHTHTRAPSLSVKRPLKLTPWSHDSRVPTVVYVPGTRSHKSALRDIQKTQDSL